MQIRDDLFDMIYKSLEFSLVVDSLLCLQQDTGLLLSTRGWSRPSVRFSQLTHSA